MVKKTNKKPLISIVSCCYNVSEYIPAFMDSLLHQKYDNNKLVANSEEIEIIMVEDCSKDYGKTLKLLKQYKNKYSNIKLVKMKKNEGLSAGRNAGLKKASGKYITFPDPDDLLADGIINEYIKTVHEGNYDVACFGITERHFDSKNKLILEKKIKLNNRILKNKKQVAKKTVDLEKQICFGFVWNKLYKTSLITKNNLHFIKGLKFIEDVLFNIEYFKHCNNAKISNKQAIIYNRRLKSSSSITSNYEKNYFELHYLRVESLYKYWKDFGVLDKHAISVLSNLYLRYSLSAIWRNKNKKSNMNLAKQKLWLKSFYELEMTKILLPYAKSESFKNSISNYLFKNKHINLLLLEASIIEFVTNNMDKTLIKLRQKR